MILAESIQAVDSIIARACSKLYTVELASKNMPRESSRVATERFPFQ